MNIELGSDNPDRQLAIDKARERCIGLVNEAHFLKLLTDTLRPAVGQCDPVLLPDGRVACGAGANITLIDKVDVCNVEYEIVLAVKMKEVPIIEPAGTGIVVPGDGSLESLLGPKLH